MDVDDLDRVDWEKLSVESLWTLSRIVVPMMDGELQSDVAKRLGWTRSQVGARMVRLRRELREQLDETAA